MGKMLVKRILNSIALVAFGLFAACVISLCELMGLTIEVDDG